VDKEELEKDEGLEGFEGGGANFHSFVPLNKESFA
jgi:hypothetical protein